MATNTDEREEIKPVAPTEQTKWRDPSLVGKYMVDPKTGLAGLFRSPDNGETWVLTDTVYGHVYNQDEVDNIWDNGAAHKVADEIKSATADLPNIRKQADEAVKFAESAIAVSKVNSDAIVAQSSAVVEAKSAMDSATAEIQQLKANAASDVAQIRADVAQVQNEVDTAKAANSASVDKLKSDIGLAQKDLDNVRDSLTKAQSAVEQNQKLINDSVAKINNDITQSRQDIVTAQQANDDLAKQLDTYSKEAQEQGKTIKTIQDNQDGFSVTIADVKGDVTKVSDTVDGLSAGLKDAQGNIASVKAQADQLNATLTDHSKNIAQLTATAKELSSTLEDADGRLSKVEQTASEQSTTLSDLQGNLTQVEQTADNLVTTLKDAQGNIDQIKQDAKGTLEQLSNAEGDITALQKDVSGIKLTIADHDKNIHTLQTDSKTLKDDMADAKGNISSLQKTSTSLVSEFRDHDGRLSKVEQTATEHTSELADTKGNLDKVTQKANTLQLLLSDAQKNIQNIQLDAKGLHDTLTGQNNQLANLNVTLNNLDSKYSGITGDLQSKQTALSTEQQQTKDMLLRKADQSEVDNVKGTVSQVSAEQKVMADQINQKVSSTEYQTLKDKVNGMKVGGRNYILNSAKKVFYPVGQDDYDLCWNVSKEAFNVNPDKNGQYKTHFSFDMQASSALPIARTWRIYWRASPWTSFGIITYPANTTNVQHYELKITTPATQPIADEIFIRFMKEDTGKPSYTITNSLLTIGDVFEDYSPNPDDAIASIKKNSTAIDENNKLISLMAKQTEVDNVKNTAQQLSARLDVMAGEVKSKVDETRVNSIVDGKGYATTSTVQSLVDQKAGTINESIANLTNKLVNNNGGGVNLVSGTIEDIVVDDTANTGTQGWCFNTIPINADLKVGDKITVSVENVTTTGRGDLSKWGATLYSKDISEMRANNYEVNAGKNSQVTITVTSMNDPNKQTALLIYSGRVGDTEGKKAVFHHLKVERGEIATPYSQAPSDNATVTQLQSVTASIDGLQSRVTNYQNDTSSKYTQLSSLMQSKVNQGDLSSVRTQLANAINDRVGKGELMSQINLQAGNILIQTGKLYLDSSSVVFSGRAFIPSAAIAELDADKLTFYGNGSKASIGAGIAQYDQDKIKSTINLQYQGGFEIHSSNQLGSILTMHDNTVRLAVKSNGMANPNSPTDQYSGFYASTSYSLMNSYLKDGTTSGISIGSADSGVNKDYRIYVYDGSNASNNLSKGISISTSSRFDVYAGNSQLFLGPDKAELRGNDHATVHGNDHTFIEGGNQQIYMHNGEVNIGNPNDTGNATGVHLRVFGWASFNGYVEGMGWTTKSTLSSKTRIEKLDTEDALNKIMETDLETYQYKAEVAGGMTKRHAGPIIDDVHDVAQYSTPDEFINERRTGRSDADVIGYLMGAVQELKKQLDKVKEKI